MSGRWQRCRRRVRAILLRFSSTLATHRAAGATSLPSGHGCLFAAAGRTRHAVEGRIDGRTPRSDRSAPISRNGLVFVAKREARRGSRCARCHAPRLSVPSWPTTRRLPPHPTSRCPGGLITARPWWRVTPAACASSSSCCSTNAVAAHRGVVVLVAILWEPSSVTVRAADNGIGIADADLPHVFDRSIPARTRFPTAPAQPSRRQGDRGGPRGSLRHPARGAAVAPWRA